jgi:hypothetical protein
MLKKDQYWTILWTVVSPVTECSGIDQWFETAGFYADRSPIIVPSIITVILIKNS